MSINFNNNPNSYPFVLIPKKILKNFDYKLSDLEVCKELNIVYPEIPIFNILKYPMKPKPYSGSWETKNKVVIDGELGGCFAVIVIPICLLVLYGLYVSIIEGLVVGIISMSLALILLISKMGLKEKTKKEYVKTPMDENKYQLELDKYNTKCAELETEHSENIKKYELEKKVVQKKISENYDEVSKLLFVRQVKSFVGVQKIKQNGNRGKSELFFLTKLYSKFSSQINVDVVPKDGMNPFQPDFVLICNETGFHIDIEIDEPYSASNGIPIHHDRSTDENRNSFFEEINWGVIRFTERQIIQNSSACCELIDNVLFSIKTGKFKNIMHTLDVENKWNYEEALIMSNNNYRNTYLPNNMKVNISYKTVNNNDNF